MKMNQLIRNLVLAFVSLQGVMLLVDGQSRGRLYGTFSEFHQVSVPMVQNISQNFRLTLVLSLLPAFFYPSKWLIPKFISLVGYVFYICINCNVMIFHQPSDIKFLVVHLLLLVQIVTFLVDDIVNQEKQQQNSTKKSLTLARQQIDREQTGPASSKGKSKTS